MQWAEDRLTDALIPGQGHPSLGALLPLVPVSKPPGPRAVQGGGRGHSLHGWLWGTLSAPMTFLVSLRQKSSSGRIVVALS